MLENAYSRLQYWRFGIWPPKWGGILTKPPKSKWAERLRMTYRQNWSTAATCARDEEKKKERQRKKHDSGKLGIRRDHPRRRGRNEILHGGDLLG